MRRWGGLPDHHVIITISTIIAVIVEIIVIEEVVDIGAVLLCHEQTHLN